MLLHVAPLRGEVLGARRQMSQMECKSPNTQQTARLPLWEPQLAKESQIHVFRQPLMLRSSEICVRWNTASLQRVPSSDENNGKGSRARARAFFQQTADKESFMRQFHRNKHEKEVVCVLPHMGWRFDVVLQTQNCLLNCIVAKSLLETPHSWRPREKTNARMLEDTQGDGTRRILSKIEELAESPFRLPHFLWSTVYSWSSMELPTSTKTLKSCRVGDDWNLAKQVTPCPVASNWFHSCGTCLIKKEVSTMLSRPLPAVSSNRWSWRCLGCLKLLHQPQQVR